MNINSIVKAIETMRHENKSLPTEEEDLRYFLQVSDAFKFTTNKNKLEYMLMVSILVVEYKTETGLKKHVLCTSNNPLINVLNVNKKSEKEKAALNVDPIGMPCKAVDKVKTWDLLGKHIIFIPVETCRPVLTIRIVPDKDHILELDLFLNNILN